MNDASAMPEQTPDSVAGSLPASASPTQGAEAIAAARSRPLDRLRAVAQRNPRAFFSNALAAALVLRFVLMALPIGFWIDLNSFEAWALRLGSQGPLHFYTSIWSDYPPGYLYVLWAIGLVHQGLAGLAGLVTGRPAPAAMGLLVFLIKLPGVLCDILNAWLIFKILEGRVSRRTAQRAALFYAFNPVVILVSAIWGQMDSVLLSAMLGATYFMVVGRIEVAILVTGLAVMLKPQGAFLIPAIVATQWFRFPLKRWAVGISGALVGGWLLTLPFSWDSLYKGLWGPVPFLWNKMNETAATYPHSSVNAFNLWAPTGMWKPDSRMFWFVSHRTVGLLLLGSLLALVCWLAFKQRDRWTTARTLLVAAIVTMGCFLLPTRMHERYLLPGVAFLALAAGANLDLFWNYATFSATAWVNILYAYFLYYSPGHWWDTWRMALEGGAGLLVVMINMWVFGDLIGTLVGGHAEPADREVWNVFLATITDVGAKVRMAWTRLDTAIASSIATAFFAMGVWNLFTPNEQIFDEVYHARTAKEFIDGTNPYEWTHPHLGKLLIAVGILAMHQINQLLEAIGLRHFDPQTSPPPGALPRGVFDGFDAFGWRIVPLVFGSLSLVAVYVLARRLFGSRRIATLAAGILALDGVYFVQSRVAMTNIFTVGFIVVACLGLWEFLWRDCQQNPGWYRLGPLPTLANHRAEDQPPARDTVAKQRQRAEPWLLLWGVAIGLGMASRWSAIFAWGI
ncbi:MAG: phospholipid carrier-dependent glycosyltransferase, partial [Cyanobacteria bacterium REEB65]|nr:phospholipid carrier-dependent glycosyltransferase [Cyanobacteria bacterium REEB65]